MRVLSLAILALVFGNSLNAQDQLTPVLGTDDNPVPLINDVDEGRVAFHPASKYLNSNSVAIVELNLKQANMLELTKWVYQAQGKRLRRASQSGSQAADAIIANLVSSGIDRVYILISTQSILDRGPVLVLPCQDPDACKPAVNALRELLSPGVDYALVNSDKRLCLVPTDAAKRISSTKPEPRPDLVLPLFTQGRKSHMLVTSVPERVRKTLQPFLPESFRLGGMKLVSSQLLSDVHRAVIHWDLNPAPSAVVSFICGSADSTARTNKLIRNLMEEFAFTSNDLSLTVSGQQINLVADANQIERLLSGPLAGLGGIRQSQTLNNMKQVGLAIHNYVSAHIHMPPRAFTDPKGQELLSGRVAILPYLEQAALYGMLELGEAWDSKHNSRYGAMMLPVYSTEPSNEDGQPSTTRIRFPVVQGSIWSGDGPPKRFRDVSDGLSNTIAAIYAPQAAGTPWMSPEPWVLNKDKLVQEIFGNRTECPVLMLDGSVRVIQRDGITNEVLLGLLTIAGGEVE